MVYNSDIPQPTDRPSASQDQLLQNFQAIDSVVAVNHEAFGDADEGKHKFMQMPEQSSAPTTAANEGALYTKEASGVTNLFFRRESNGDEVQLTGGGSSSSLIVNGVQILFANVSVANGGTVNFSNAFSSAPHVVVTEKGNTSTSSKVIVVGSITTSSFVVHTDRVINISIEYIAIGAA